MYKSAGICFYNDYFTNMYKLKSKNIILYQYPIYVGQSGQNPYFFNHLKVNTV